MIKALVGTVNSDVSQVLSMTVANIAGRDVHLRY